MQGDDCAEQDALRLKEQLDSSGSAKVDVEGEDVIIMPNMVDIKKESRSGGYAQLATLAIAITSPSYMTAASVLACMLTSCRQWYL